MSNLSDQPQWAHLHFNHAAETLTDELRSTALVSTILVSPLYTMTQAPGVAMIPVLRTVGDIVCILDIAGGICALVLYVRLATLRRHGDSCASNLAERIISLRSSNPIFSASFHLMYSSLVLFFFVILGYAWAPTTAVTEHSVRGAIELGIIGATLSSALALFGLVVRTSFRSGPCANNCNAMQSSSCVNSEKSRDIYSDAVFDGHNIPLRVI